MKTTTTNKFVSIILIALIFISTAVYGAIFLNNHIKHMDNYTNSLIKENNNLLSNTSLLLSEVLLSEKEMIVTSANDLSTMDLSNDTTIKSYIQNRSKGFTTIGAFYFVRVDGAQFLNSNLLPPTGFNPQERSWYMNAVNAKKLVLSESYVDSLTNKLCITLSAPVYKDSVLMGVVGLDIFMDKFYSIFLSLSANHSNYLFIADYSGNLVIAQNSEITEATIKDFLKKITAEPDASSILDKQNWVQLLNKTNGVINVKTSNGVRIIGSYTTMKDEGWKIVSIADPGIYNSTYSKMQSNFYLSVSIGILVISMLILIVVMVNLFIDKKRIKYTLTHDALTGLPNKQYLESNFKNEVSANAIDCSLHLIDIDNFKFLNDTLGHDYGDEILITVANLLKNILPRDGILVRSGGDQFSIMLKDVTIESSNYFAERIQNSISNSALQIKKHSLDISISTGYTVIDNSFSIMKFYSVASAALNIAKEEGKNRAVCLLPEDNAIKVENNEQINEIITLIKTSLRERSFVIFLQPIMEIENKKIRHYEALLRMRGKDDKLLSPGIFIPIAERFGMISEIDKYVFTEVMKIIKDHPKITIFMNISGLSLNNNTLLEYFEKSILESGISSTDLNLGLEITETSSTKNFTQAQHWMEKFKKLGCTIALDDFGVGYTSFTYLRTLPADYIKIDGSFVHNIDKDSSHRAIVQTMNTLAISLGKNTIAEFVENEDVLKVLKEIGVKFGQGYHLGKPGPIDDILL